MLAPGDAWSLSFSGCGSFPRPDYACKDARSNADRSVSFLRGLDAYVTTTMEGLHPYVDAALAEALATGVPVISPRRFAPLLGNASLPVADGDWQATFRCLNAKALSNAATAARKIGKQCAPEQLRRRLAELKVEPAKRQRVLTLQRESRSSAQVLFISPNGIGMGHLTRLLAVARRLEPWLQPIFLTMSQGAGVVDDFEFTVEYVPYFKSYNGQEETWQKGFQAKLEQVIGFYDPRVVVFDGNVPYRALLAVCENRPERFFIWCRRGLWRRQAQADIVERDRAFDLVVEPRDHAEAYDRGPTMARREMVVRIPPITLLDHGESETRARARQELGLPMDATALLVMLGSGNNFEMSWVADTIREAIGERDDLVVRRAKWMISQRSMEDQAIDIEGYPFARYFNAFDFAVSAAGYNSFHELMAARLPAIFVPNDNPVMDDQRARALWAERSAMGYCVYAWDKFRLGWALNKLLDPDTRLAMRARINTISRDNGAIAFAELIRDLALCRKADRGRPG